MVGLRPLEASILVRIQVPQHESVWYRGKDHLASVTPDFLRPSENVIPAECRIQRRKNAD